MRFNLGFILIYVMPYVAVIASLWGYTGRLNFSTSDGEVSDNFVRAIASYFVTVFFCIVWILKSKRSNSRLQSVNK